MLDLSSHIKQLLLVHDCVILPGFGGFVANYTCATHNESTHTFSPPSKQLLFNSSLTYNDGLLTGEVAHELGIAYSEAEAMISQCIDEAWIKLEKGESLNMEGIGIFSLTGDQTLSFTPQLTENLLTDSYGLTAFRFPPLSYKYNNEHVINNDNIRKMPVIDTQKLLRYAAIVVPIAALIGLIPIYKHHSQQDAGLPGVPVHQSIEDNISASNREQTVDNAIAASTDKRTALFYNEVPQQRTEVSRQQQPQNCSYYIIGGSFKDRSNAEKHVKKYKKAGFDSEIIETDRLYRVTLGIYGDKVIALHELRRIRAAEEYSNAWLYTMTNED